MTRATSGSDSCRSRVASSSNTSTATIELGSTRSGAMSKLTTLSGLRLGSTTAANASSASSVLSGWHCTLKRMTITAPPPVRADPLAHLDYYDIGVSSDLQ